MITQGIHFVKRVTKSETTRLGDNSYSTRIFVYTDDSDHALVLTLFTDSPDLKIENAGDHWNEDRSIIDDIRVQKIVRQYKEI